METVGMHLIFNRTVDNQQLMPGGFSKKDFWYVSILLKGNVMSSLQKKNPLLKHFSPSLLFLNELGFIHLKKGTGIRNTTETDTKD